MRHQSPPLQSKPLQGKILTKHSNEEYGNIKKIIHLSFALFVYSLRDTILYLTPLSVSPLTKGGDEENMLTIIYNRTMEKEKRKALRNNMTEVEILLWLQLRKRQ